MWGESRIKYKLFFLHISLRLGLKKPEKTHEKNVQFFKQKISTFNESWYLQVQTASVDLSWRVKKKKILHKDATTSLFNN